MQLSILPTIFAVCRLEPNSPLPQWINKKYFYSITHTPVELSIVCVDEGLPADVKKERNWKVIQVLGPLDFSLTGILASLANPLAAAKVSIFAISTFDTDYMLVQEEKLGLARECLEAAGFQFTN